MKQKLKWDEITGLFLLAVSTGLLGVSVFLCFSGDIWYDELFTMRLAEQSLGGLISMTARDVHPPLYYIIVKLFLALLGGMKGSMYRAAAAKLVSVLPFFLCFVYALTKVRKHFGLLSAGVFCFLLITMPQMADYTVEVRMYGYALFFITAGMLHAYELAGGGQERSKEALNWAALTLYALAACYTHYFACVGACMIYLYLFIMLLKEGRLKNKSGIFLLSGICCVAGYLPWLWGAVVHQVGNVKENYWIQPLSWRSLGGCVKFVFQPQLQDERLRLFSAAVLFLIYGILLTGALIKQWNQIRTQEPAAGSADGKAGIARRMCFMLGCLGVLAGIILFGFLASFLIRPIFVYRYMLPALGLFWLVFALLVSELKQKKAIFSVLILLIMTVGFLNYRAFYGEEMWKRVQMKQAEQVLAGIGPEDILVYNFDQAQGVISYYLNNDSYLWYGTPEELIRELNPGIFPLVEGAFSDEEGIGRMKELLQKGRRVWFLGSGNAREEIIEKWENAGMKVTENAEMMIERYWVKLYLCERNEIR